MLEIEVCEIRGKRPVHKVGDKMVIEDLGILLDRTDTLCVRISYKNFTYKRIEAC